MKVFEFYWDAGGYGRGVMVVAAPDKESAIEHAKYESQNWHFDSEIFSLQYIGNSTEPTTIVSQYYQE